MKKLSPPPVPPLGDAALDRIERGVFAALDARAIRPDVATGGRRRVLAFAMAGAACAGVVFGVREWRRGETLPARAAEISTTTSGSHIDIAGAALDVAPRSAVSVGGRDGAVVVVLVRGSVTCEVAPRTTRAPFIVEAGATRVTVIGTRFTVHRIGDHATVSVEHGLVEVADTNMTELVHAGERFRPGEPVSREPLASEAPTVAVAAAAPPRSGVAPAAAPTPSAPAELALAAAPARKAHRRHVALADEPRQTQDADRPTDEAAGVETPRAAEAKVPAQAADSLARAEAPAPPAEARGAVAPRRSVQVLFELAAQLEIRDAEAALRIYGELAAGEDGWAASALFASARLESERGQTARARSLCEAYLQRFPRGPNADDARSLLATPH